MKKNIAVLGLSRSGTTWAAKIIDSHPNVIYRHEPDSEIKIPIPLVTHSNENYFEAINAFYGQIERHATVRACGKQPLFNKQYFNALNGAVFKSSVFFARLAGRLNVPFNVVERVSRSQAGELVWLWKSIESVGRVGSLLAALPNLKIIYIIRHPYGQIASVLQGEKNAKFLGRTPFSEDYGVFSQLLNTPYAIENKITLAKVKAMMPIERMALARLLFNEHVLNALEHFKSRACVVSYEALRDDPLGQSRAVFDFCQLDWNKQSEAFVKSSTSVHDTAYYSVFKRPSVDTESTLTPADKNAIKAIINAYPSSRCYARYRDVL